MNKPLPLTIVLALAIWVLSACAGPVSPGARGETTPVPTPAGSVVVENVSIRILESFPVQVIATLTGYLPDGCTTIERVTQARSGNGFALTVVVSRPAGSGCSAVVQPFAQSVPLQVTGLKKGVYRVTAGAATAQFELTADNVLVVNNGSIAGVVWHDLCVSGAHGQPGPAAPPPGCAPGAQGGYEANGVREAGEPGIAGVMVVLRAGRCPVSHSIAQTTTGADGSFRFGALAAGDYCLEIDSLHVQNALLLPGGWTHPERGNDIPQRYVSLFLADGEQKQGTDFGWDYQFLPSPPVTPTTPPATATPTARCVNRAAFVADVNYPDGSTVSPGQSFVKTWRIRNVGTCAWNTGYTLSLVSARGVGAPQSVNLPRVTTPGATLDVSVSLVAQNAAGLFEVRWRLKNVQGELFGIEQTPDGAFWARGKVVGAPACCELGRAEISGRVWHDLCAVAGGEGGAPLKPSPGCVPDPQGGFRANGIREPNEPGIANVTVRLWRGACGSAEKGWVKTSANGAYRFIGLDAGVYCVSVSATEPGNNILPPGEWSHPAPAISQRTISLADGEIRSDAHFGWDYQFLPKP